jgi:acetyl esterase/lipase
MKKTLIGLSFVLIASIAQAQEPSMTYKQISDIPYYDKTTTTTQPANVYQTERCKLDLYYPENAKGFATLIWFHGGGLTGGEKCLPDALKNQNIAIVTPNYRLSGDKAKCPDYIQDAAAATAWTLKNIKNYGGDPKKVFICGSSAGGYLSAMVGMDGEWLKTFGCSNQELAGIIPMTGQMTTHFQIKNERNIPQTQTIVDKFAPISHISKDLPPILLIVGDRKCDWPARTEENLFLAGLLQRVACHTQTQIIELQGYDHGMACGAFPPVLTFVHRVAAATTQPAK